MSLTPPSCLSRLNKYPQSCRLVSALFQREKQLSVCLLVGDSTRTCGHAVANTKPRAGNQHCQTCSSSAGTGERNSAILLQRETPPKRDRERERERDLVTEQRMRMQWDAMLQRSLQGRKNKQEDRLCDPDLKM